MEAPYEVERGLEGGQEEYKLERKHTTVRGGWKMGPAYEIQEYCFLVPQGCSLNANTFLIFSEVLHAAQQTSRQMLGTHAFKVV